MPEVPTWEVDLFVDRPITTLPHRFRITQQKGFLPGNPFYSNIEIGSIPSGGLRATVTARASNEQLAFEAAVVFFGRMLDVLAFKVDLPLFLSLTEQGPRNGRARHNSRRIIGRLEIEEAFQEADDLRLTQPPFLRSLGWYRKGLYTEDPLDKFQAFWGSKTLLGAVEIGLFTDLAKEPLDAETLGERLMLHPRSARDFLDALVSLGMLERDGDQYANTPETDLYLDRTKPSYIGGILEMANARLYPFWGSLTEALRTGQPQNEAKRGENFFTALYADPGRLKSFLKAMTGISMGAAMAIANKFPWDRYQTFVDVGTAQGGLPVQVALAHDHLLGGGFDLPPVGPFFEEYVDSHGLGDRLRFYPGDFFEDPLPAADVFVMGRILYNWDLEGKKMLLGKAYEALPEGGAMIVYDTIIDNERSENAFGLLMSLNMLIETPGGFDYTGADCSSWMRETGFRETHVEHLVGPDSMVVGTK